ncbi:hypothetical protein M409DRAFT_21723 [Zasmidium cellare ATCC 36951]|uniref:Uncharacterized protein n=1 Tax=Zasmidium cellare ATCC 36951 TaxID=1080233 RepID=A0A6A6CMA5_ZASCE|nr:uncharacterized protein M409DRAFT_21723 [Zasmidium cellare ATCC 36951]KAF2168285.1 hypothetical protein M409DRAFT_21723 [Zasmidium cellare ATCC 36951]
MASHKKHDPQTLLLPTHHATGVERRVTEDSLSKCNLQEDSPLFAVLPAELRTTIFELATQPYDDPSHPYKEEDYYYRPGHHTKPKTDTALLLTCRLIWLETNHLPLHQSCPTFWFKAEERRPEWTRRAPVLGSRYSLRRPKTRWITEEERYKRFMAGLTAQNGENLREMRFFGQLAWLESWQLTYLLSSTQPIPPRIVVTVRHTDWWWWENDSALAMDIEWIWRLLKFNSGVRKAREFVLELETLDFKVDHLFKGIVEGIQKECGEIEGWVLQDGAGKEVSEWTGPATIGGRAWVPYVSRTELRYKLFSLVWKRQEDESR